MIRLFILLVLVLCSCSNSSVVKEEPPASGIITYSKDSLYLHFTDGFVNDYLAIEYSGNSIVETGVTTDEALGFAKEIILPFEVIDTMRVSLKRPNKTYYTKIINDGGNFIEVWYCKDDELKHYIRTEPFSYE
jgi:hypothetical protein